MSKVKPIVSVVTERVSTVTTENNQYLRINENFWVEVLGGNEVEAEVLHKLEENYQTGKLDRSKADKIDEFIKGFSELIVEFAEDLTPTECLMSIETVKYRMMFGGDAANPKSESEQKEEPEAVELTEGESIES